MRNWEHEPPAKKIWSGEVINAVCLTFKIHETSLLGQSRLRACVRPRQAAAYLMHKYCGLSLTQIGTILDGRDHTTVIHALRKVDKLMREDDGFATLISACEDYIIKNSGVSPWVNVTEAIDRLTEYQQEQRRAHAAMNRPDMLNHIAHANSKSLKIAKKINRYWAKRGVNANARAQIVDGHIVVVSDVKVAMT